MRCSGGGGRAGEARRSKGRMRRRTFPRKREREEIETTHVALGKEGGAASVFHCVLQQQFDEKGRERSREGRALPLSLSLSRAQRREGKKTRTRKL